ncbi:MAG: hypothetical protein JF606_08155, partial [Burkholderiales bacterium]|nr:hypothetical protein [Burkholderiales bacterium]
MAYQIDPSQRGGYNVGFCARILADVDPQDIRNSLAMLVARHPMLRASFEEGDNGPRQRIHQHVELPFQWHDANDWSAEKLHEHITDEYRRPFLNGPVPLLRAHLYRISKNESVLLWVLDHLICDGVSFWLLMEEWGALLECRGAGLVPEFVHEPEYFAYVRHEAQWLDSPKAGRQLSHWKQVLSSEPAPLDLRHDAADASQDLPQRRSLPCVLPPELAQAIRSLAARHGVTLYTVLLAAYFILLRRHTGQDRLAVGAPISSRSESARSTVGNCTNTVVLTADFELGLTVSGLLSSVNSMVLRALRNRHYPFSELVQRLNPRRDSTHHPYFQTRFNFQNERGTSSVKVLMAEAERGADVDANSTVMWGGWTVAPYGLEMSRGDVGNALDIEVGEFADKLGYSLRYDARRLKRSTVSRYVEHLHAVFDAMVTDDAHAVDGIDLLSHTERRQVLIDWNATQADYPRDQCIHELIEAQVRRSPEATAVVHEGGSLSYAELNRRANRLAHALIEQGVT